MRLSRAVAPLLLAAFVAACSGASTGAAPTSAAVAAATSGTENGSGSSPAAAAGGLALVKTSLGNVLVGPNGMTLYMFVPDTATTSACTGNCAASWPPLTGDLPTLGTGLTAASFGSITRADGTKQVAFNGHPLYYFGGDKAAGDTNGQGLNSKWYVLGSDGNPIK